MILAHDLTAFAVDPGNISFSYDFDPNGCVESFGLERIDNGDIYEPVTSIRFNQACSTEGSSAGGLRQRNQTVHP